MNWWQYLLLVNLYLLLFYGFYALLLRRETFFQLNRIYLVSAALLSFFIPMIQSDWVKNLFITQRVQYTIYNSPVLTYRFQPTEQSHITIGQILTVLYLAGITFLVFRLVFQLVALKKFINRPDNDAAFAFFKKVRLTDGHEHNAVIAEHENAHASQWHSADVLLMEFLLIVNWFNPIVYFYRYAVKHIHEFIADRQAVRSGTDRADYALILLSQTFDISTHNLVNPFFNKTLLKQRIKMLQKDRSRRVALFKYFLSAPLFMLMLILSSATVNNSRALHIINNKVQGVLQLTAVKTGETRPAAITAPVKSQLIINETNIAKKQDSVTIDAVQPGSAPANSTGSTANTKADITINTTATPAAATINNEEPAVKTDNAVFTAVEQTPTFPGGYEAFTRFLGKNIKYPEEALHQNVQGRTIIGFVVEKDGSLSNIRVLRPLGAGTDEEAMRVIALSPKWIPGVQNGHPVRVSYTVPITFALDNAEKSKPADNPPSPGVIANAGQNLLYVKGNIMLDTSKASSGNWENESAFAQHRPLYVIDGKSTEDMSFVNPKDIYSISVFKGNEAKKVYGEKAKYGAIIITTKQSARKANPLSMPAE